MANVQITGPVRNEIANAISNLQSRELENNPLPFEFRSLAAKVPTTPLVDKLWGENLHLKDKIPHEWKQNCDTINVYVKFVTADGKEHGGSSGNYRLQVTPQGGARNQRFLIPPNMSSYPSVNLFADDPILAPIHADLQNYFNVVMVRKEVAARWQKVRNDVDAFLNNYKSINAALKDWAGLRRFLTPDIIERLERKNAAPRKEIGNQVQTDKGIVDMEALEAASVIGALLKGGE